MTRFITSTCYARRRLCRRGGERGQLARENEGRGAGLRGLVVGVAAVCGYLGFEGNCRHLITLHL